MKILFVMPHYFGAGPSDYGSTDLAKKAQRIHSMSSCIASLHQQFGRSQKQLLAAGDSKEVNQAMTSDVEVVVCVRGTEHLLDELDLPQGSFRIYQTDIENPLLLGYKCYEVLKEEFGKHDWYCFLEDDIVISDPLFFFKLRQFYNTTGDARYLLQPNRFELAVWPGFSKAYVDGPLSAEHSELLMRNRLPGCRDEIMLPFGDVKIRMIPAQNIHSGCFFLTDVHLQHMLEQPWYGKPVVGYADILTGVSNMYILALFNVFKPADECASFLEVHHHYQKYVGL